MPISVDDLEALEDRALSIAQLTTIGLLSLFAEASRVGATLARPSTDCALSSPLSGYTRARERNVSGASF